MRNLVIGLAAAIVAVLVGTFIAMHPSTKDQLVIDWNGVAEAEGARVFVDGRDVGALHTTLGRNSTKFRFEQGHHEVRVDVPGYDCCPTTIVTHYPEEEVVLTLVPAGQNPDPARATVPALEFRQ